MINVTRQRSAENGCYTQTALNHLGEVEGNFCMEHAHEGMVRPTHDGPAALCPSGAGARRTARRVQPSGRGRCIAGTGRCLTAEVQCRSRLCLPRSLCCHLVLSVGSAA